MKVRELIEMLEELLEEAEVEDAEVLLAQQPNWPLAFTLREPTFCRGKVWLPEGYHPSDSPYAPRDAWEGGVIAEDEDES